MDILVIFDHTTFSPNPILINLLYSHLAQKSV